MGHLLQKLLDRFYLGRKALTSVLAYLSLRTFGLEIAWTDICAGKYSRSEHSDLQLESAIDTEALLSTARQCLTGAQERRTEITGKCHTLLTMASLLLGVIGLFSSTTVVADSIWSKVLFFIAVAALLNTVTLLLVFFDVGVETKIVLDQHEVDLEGDDIRKNLINLSLQCQSDIDNRTDYLVDVYRTARCFFLFALTLATLMFCENLIRSPQHTRSQLFLQDLRSDPDLIELLRGSKGEQGEKGPTGEKGDRGIQGLQGEKGKSGADATVDLETLVQLVFADPRLQDLLAKKADDTPEASGDSADSE